MPRVMNVVSVKCHGVLTALLPTPETELFNFGQESVS